MAKAEHCDNKNWRLDELDSYIESKVSQLLFDPSYYEALLKQKKTETASAPPSEADAIRGKIANLDKQIGRMMDLYQDDRIPMDVVSSRIDKLHREKTALEAQLVSLDPPKPRRDHNEDAFAGLISDFATVWQSASLEDRRAIISTLIRRINLDGENVDIEWAFLE